MDECRIPPPLNDEDLEAALDGAAAPGILAHLAQCPACSDRLAALRVFEQTLTQRLFRWQCPDPQALSDYHFGFLPATEQAAITTHMELCLRCRDELSELRRFLQEQSPPRASQTSPVHHERSRRWGELIAQVLPPTPGLALRGTGSDMLVAEAEGITIFLSLEQSPRGAAVIAGQIAADDLQEWAGALVELWQQDHLQATLIVNEWGAFRYDGFQPGYPSDLRIHAATGRIVAVYDVHFPTQPINGDA